MLELWRPPENAGEPIGCLATTYTFDPGLFDEPCLGRFLEIESEPDREDLAFLLERENRLGSVYAGVLVDHTQAGVAHSLRWDVLPVRVRAGKQHAKLSLLAWSHHIRIIVASANLTEQGYRMNREVAATVNLSPKEADKDLLMQATTFLRDLLALVPGAQDDTPEVRRASVYLSQVERQVETWERPRRETVVRQQLVCTQPAVHAGSGRRSSLDEAVEACRRSGRSPHEAWVASPFFDVDDNSGRVAAALCKSMARGLTRKLRFCVPAVRDEGETALPRLAAPEAIRRTPLRYRGHVSVAVLPDLDADKNRRFWHAKMLALRGDSYTALMTGSSNFTCAGMGAAPYRNAEANVLTVVDRVAYGRETSTLEAVWSEMDPVEDPDAVEWLGSQPETDEEEAAVVSSLPAGFVSGTYRAGDDRKIVLRLDPARLPPQWRIHACGRDERELLTASVWAEAGSGSVVTLSWLPLEPPDRLLVLWDGEEAFLPLNVEDGQQLPPPARLEQMSADDMLWILAAADPSAAFRAWARDQQPSDRFDTDGDSATPVDLNPLRRHDLQVTFLYRIRRRARILTRKIRGVFRFRYRHKSPMWYKCSVNNHLRHHGGPCVTTDTVPQTVLFPDLFDKPLFAQFNQEQASSDGGAILLKAAERIYGLVKAFAGCLFDKRAPDKTRHSLADLIGQRIFGIACGHPDCNDGDRLADDPIHKLLLDRDPVSGERLASQPTLSRFENAVNGCALYRMADELATRVIARHRRRLDGRARCITIDLDPTDDPTHGAQQYTLFNGYYDNWCYLPLLGFLTFDRESEQYLCAALLRHGKAVASEGTVGLLSRLLPRLRRAFPRARILVRLDGGFASPAVFAFLEAQPRLDYVIAMAKNAVLERYAEPAMLVARARTWRSEQTEHVYTETDEYQAGTWNHARRVVIKAEVVRHRRGDAENRIKELKALQIDRTSCQTFSANQLRVLLTAAAYVLMQELRLRAADTACARAQVPWLRDRLLKLGVQVVRSARRIVLRLPRATPDLAAWRHIAFALGARAG